MADIKEIIHTVHFSLDVGTGAAGLLMKSSGEKKT